MYVWRDLADGSEVIQLLNYVKREMEREYFLVKFSISCAIAFCIAHCVHFTSRKLIYFRRRKKGDDISAPLKCFIYGRTQLTFDHLNPCLNKWIMKQQDNVSLSLTTRKVIFILRGKGLTFWEVSSWGTKAVFILLCF